MTNQSKPLIEVNDLQVKYESQQGTVVAIEAVNLQLHRGEIGVLIGPSGCGKSTLLHILAGVKHDYSGEVLHTSESTQNAKPKTALILQDYGLFPWKTIRDNIGLGLAIRKQGKVEMMKTIERVAEQMGIDHLLDRYPNALSGGQRQRVAIARALALQPDVLLMDEPFSALDALTREELQDLIVTLWKETHLSVLLVTHSIEEAAYLGQRIFVMSPSPGRVIATVKNEAAGVPDFRGKPEFYQLCHELRSYLKRERDRK